MNDKIQVISKYALEGLNPDALKDAALAAKQTLESGNGAGNDFLGWLHLPSSIDEQQLADIENEVRHYRDQFRGKTVLCNCDDPRCSNFFKYNVRTRSIVNNTIYFRYTSLNSYNITTLSSNCCRTIKSFDS